MATKKEMFNDVLSLIDNGSCKATLGELRDFISHEIELLEKKAATPRKPTANQVENESFKQEIIDYLSAEDKLKSIKEMQEAIPSLAGISNQRITHILSALVNNDTLVKEYVKKTPFYGIKK